jgi:hypothetical protein
MPIEKTDCLGVIGVDTGSLWVGDPCYSQPGKTIDWDRHLDWLYEHGMDKATIDGAWVGTTYGDGGYKVYIGSDGEQRYLIVELG